MRNGEMIRDLSGSQNLKFSGDGTDGLFLPGATERTRPESLGEIGVR